jgi:hypothetical protein
LSKRSLPRSATKRRSSAFCESGFIVALATESFVNMDLQALSLTRTQWDWRLTQTHTHTHTHTRRHWMLHFKRQANQG